MPVIYPQVPMAEGDVRARIVSKYAEYIAVHSGRNADPVQLQGERYEIAAIIALRQRFTHGNQISRWHRWGASQSISIGHNTEYDFIIPTSQQIPRMPQVQGPLLGEAKSYANGLGAYVKKAVGYCLNDPTLGGFCFVTPGGDYAFFLQMMQMTIAILAGAEGAPGISGGDAWKNAVARNGKPSGAQILQYFRGQYYQHQQHTALTGQNYVEVLQNQHAGDAIGYMRHTLNPYTQLQQADLFRRLVNRRATADFYNQELAQHAGFVIGCYQVANVTHDQLRATVGNLPP